MRSRRISVTECTDFHTELSGPHGLRCCSLRVLFCCLVPAARELISHGYLKVVSLTGNRESDVVGDDLASLALDAAAEEEGYRCTGFNPLALPG
ncbi:formate dehydrogenase accessory protein FdhE [Ciceribacter sichuanensis]|uniref:formate dehydrogenase accessory protein FdhE domain-containing protein n=1 Tax=Ciceribacter sichuanensis TaxID=2949647 RepID=UPI003CC91B60